MNLNLKTVTFPSNGTIMRVDLNVIGTSIQCIQANADFFLQIDEGVRIPFGVARRIMPTKENGEPLGFSKLTLSLDSISGAADVVVVLIIGTANFSDGRVALYPNQVVQAAVASTIVSRNVTIPDANPNTIGVGSGHFLVNVRNMDAANAIRVHSDSAELLAGRGYYIGPGENADFPTSLNLKVIGAIGTQIVATGFTY